MTPMIEAIELAKSFGDFKAVRELTFSIGSGEVVGFLGPNGAGKTTTFRMLAGSLGPSHGIARIGGFDLARQPNQAKSLIGYMPEAPPLYPEMTVREYLGYRASLRGLAGRKRSLTVSASAERTHTDDVLDSPIGQLSKGYKQRVALSDALLGDPPVLLLDEPTAGLDPNQVLEVRALLRELGRERAVLLSTHVLSEIEAVCETALVIHHGRLVAQGTLAELKARSRGAGARLVVRGSEAAARGALTAAGLEVQSSTTDQAGLTQLTVQSSGTSPTSDPVERAVAALALAHLGVLEAGPLAMALDDVFRSLTQETGVSAEGTP